MKRVITILILTLMMAACGSSPASKPAVVSPTPLPVLTTIVVSPQGVTVQANTAGLEFTAVAKDQNGTPLAVQPSFTWATTLGGMSSGTLTVNCLSGTATVTASASGIKGTAMATVTPYQPVLQTVTLSPGSLNLTDSGASSSATVTPVATDQCNNPVTESFAYTSSNPSAATVTAGLVSAVNQGQNTSQVSSTVTASAGNPAVVSNPVSVIVNPVAPPATSVATVVVTPSTIPTLTAPDANGFVGSGIVTAQLTAIGYNSLGAVVPLTGNWTSGTNVSVIDGLVTALTEGATRVQFVASTTGENGDSVTVYSNAVVVTVAPAPQAWAINVTPTSATIVNTVTATFTPQEVDQYSDPWPNPVYSTTAPSNGSVSINPNQSMTYTPNAGFAGNDSFTIYDPNTSATPATVTINVTAPVNLQGPWEVLNGVGLNTSAAYFEVNVAQSGNTITANQAVGLSAPLTQPLWGPYTTAAAIDLAYNGTNIIGTVSLNGLVTILGCSGYPVVTSSGTTISNCAHSVPVLSAGAYSGAANVAISGSIYGYCDNVLTAAIGTPAANYEWSVSYSCDWVQMNYTSPAPYTAIVAPMMQIGTDVYFYGQLILSNNSQEPVYGDVAGDPAIDLLGGFVLQQ